MLCRSDQHARAVAEDVMRTRQAAHSPAAHPGSASSPGSVSPGSLYRTGEEKFSIAITTGSSLMAGTDSKVTIGIQRKTGEWWIPTELIPTAGQDSKPFQRGRTARFTATCPAERAVGAPLAVRVMQDGKGMLSDWQLQQVLLTNLVTAASWRFVR